MSERMQLLAQAVFGRPSVADIGLDEVRSLAQRYPFFAGAQFLLLEKLEGSADHAAQLQKATLYYHNPLEFEYFTSSLKFQSEPVDLQIAASPLVVTEDPDTNSLRNETVTTQVGEVVTELQAEHTSTALETPAGEDAAAEPTLPPAEEEILPPEEEVLPSVPDMEPPEKIAPVAEPTASLPADGPQEQGTLPSLKLPDATASSSLTFEPFHTVDYFASQGIKLSQEEVPKDKFGKQLKSFTEWLRTMKKLPATEASTINDPGSESSVQHLAADSVHSSDVVTEAMAEVWEKQGNHAKATEVYHKLSLQNPSKKAYFAAKIENLKRS